MQGHWLNHLSNHLSLCDVDQLSGSVAGTRPPAAEWMNVLSPPTGVPAYFIQCHFSLSLSLFIRKICWPECKQQFQSVNTTRLPNKQTKKQQKKKKSNFGWEICLGRWDFPHKSSQLELEIVIDSRRQIDQCKWSPISSINSSRRRFRCHEITGQGDDSNESGAGLYKR